MDLGGIGEYLEHIRRLKDEWSNEIPGKIIHSASPNNLFKVRKNWFQAVIADADNIIEDGYASETSGMHEYEHRTNKEDIDIADRLLESLITDLVRQ